MHSTNLQPDLQTDFWPDLQRLALIYMLYRLSWLPLPALWFVKPTVENKLTETVTVATLYPAFTSMANFTQTSWERDFLLLSLCCQETGRGKDISWSQGTNKQIGNPRETEATSERTTAQRCH